MRFRILLTVAPLFFAASVFAQNTYLSGLLPQMNISKGMKNGYELNTKLEQRTILSEGFTKERLQSKLKHERVDLGFTLNKKLTLSKSAGLGYLVRNDGGRFRHRFSEQFAIVQKLDGSRLSHRFLADQTFGNQDSPEFRFRYRLSYEKALMGREIDPKGLYLKLNNEYITYFQDSDADFEIRALAFLGYNASENHKIESGFDYRINELTTNAKEHQLWFYLGWYVNID